MILRGRDDTREACARARIPTLLALSEADRSDQAAPATGACTGLGATGGAPFAMGASARALKKISAASTRYPADPMTPTGSGPTRLFGCVARKNIDRAPAPLT